ncbi:hypothetical protein B7P43_G11488 [Cryptotermes secundus]|uniref:Uncharacterized protein n=1 Tax=Cryptotermes secundus TaxID=105785 RepID=A0A2J7RRI2_9NEOP|nr:hypothetical protein B7P43_G11488 [Cryptotermes secundus]
MNMDGGVKIQLKYSQRQQQIKISGSLHISIALLLVHTDLEIMWAPHPVCTPR